MARQLEVAFKLSNNTDLGSEIGFNYAVDAIVSQVLHASGGNVKLAVEYLEEHYSGATLKALKAHLDWKINDGISSRTSGFHDPRYRDGGRHIRGS